MVLTAVQAVADAYAVGFSASLYSNLAAEAAAGDLVHETSKWGNGITFISETLKRHAAFWIGKEQRQRPRPPPLHSRIA